MVDATTLKRFFKKHFQVPVRVQGSRGQAAWFSVWIPSQPRQPGESFNAPIRYSHLFPAELGSRCMRLVYADSPGLREQNWGGNIECHRIGLYCHQWEALIAQFEPASV